MITIFNKDFENIVFETSAKPYTGLGRARLDIFNYLKNKNFTEHKNILYDYEIGIKTGNQFDVFDLFKLNKFNSEKKNLYVFTKWVFLSVLN